MNNKKIVNTYHCVKTCIASVLELILIGVCLYSGSWIYSRTLTEIVHVGPINSYICTTEDKDCNFNKITPSTTMIITYAFGIIINFVRIAFALVYIAPKEMDIPLCILSLICTISCLLYTLLGYIPIYHITHMGYGLGLLLAHIMWTVITLSGNLIIMYITRGKSFKKCYGRITCQDAC